MADVTHMIDLERDPRTVLTPRELDVLSLASAGLTNAQMAERLKLSIHAVKFHLASVYRKLNVGNRTEAAVIYLRASAGFEGPAVES